MRAGRLALAWAAIAVAVRVYGQSSAVAPAAGLASADSAGRFPHIEARSLAGRKMKLPGDLEGERNLVIVAFKRGQQPDVETWMPFLKSLAARSPDFRVYELPVLSSHLKIVRGFIDGGMKRGIRDSARRASTMTAFIHKDKFDRALAIHAEGKIYLFLVDRGGLIRWRADSTFNPELGTGLEKVLAAR